MGRVDPLRTSNTVFRGEPMTRWTTRLVLLMTFCLAPLYGSQLLAERPNIVLVMADDQGWGDAGYQGHPHLQTPNFDRAARSGLRLNRFYAAAPVCSPTRAAVLTGRHPNRMGVFKWGFSIRPQEHTLAELLAAHGYATAHFGKWHLGSVRSNSLASPGRNGFQHWVSAPNFYDNDPILCRQFNGESSVVTAQLATDWIRQHVQSPGRGTPRQGTPRQGTPGQETSASPFFVVVWFGSPHAPHRASATDRGVYQEMLRNQPDAADVRAQVEYWGEVTGMDRAFGDVRQCLAELGIEDNTLLWYTSDNGALPRVGSAGEFRGKKGSVYDGGLLVPAFVNWPAGIPAPRETDVRCNSCDILPTVLEVAQIDYPDDRPRDGISLVPLLEGRNLDQRPLGFWDLTTRGKSTPSHKLMSELLTAQQAGGDLSADSDSLTADRLPENEFDLQTFPGHAAWIQGDWKLHRIETESVVTYQLYDLQNDPAEQNDLAQDHGDRVNRMRSGLRDWLVSVSQSYNGDDYRE